jgi:hypothetical protein
MFDSRNMDPYGTRNVARSLIGDQHMDPSFSATAKTNSGFGKYAGPLGSVIGAIGGALAGNPFMGASIGGALGNMVGGASDKNAAQATSGVAGLMKEKPIATWLTNTLGGVGG